MWERIFAKHMFNKGLVSRIYKEPSNSTWKKMNIKKNRQTLLAETSLKRTLTIISHVGNANKARLGTTLFLLERL